MNTKEAIYEDETFKDVDIGEVMRSGHPGIEEGDQHILKVVKRLRKTMERPLRIIDVGSGSGHLSRLLAQQFEDSEVIANEIATASIQQSRAKLEPFANTRVFDQPFEQWNEPVDVVISWGTHHHLSHDYLQRIDKVLAPDGRLIIGDEFCPEYLSPADKERLAEADFIVIEGGYIFDNEADLNSFRQSGAASEWNLKLEDARRRALWTWYKHVGDYAVKKNVWTVLIAELQIARDDLITEFDGEHKTSPYLLERELNLNHFEVIERAAMSDGPPELESCVIYTCRAAKAR
jgi:cyclopropane fatty-acyl-phospholipid synthase-like methyltransferase